MQFFYRNENVFRLFSRINCTCIVVPKKLSIELLKTPIAVISKLKDKKLNNTQFKEETAMMKAPSTEPIAFVNDILQETPCSTGLKFNIPTRHCPF